MKLILAFLCGGTLGVLGMALLVAGKWERR